MVKEDVEKERRRKIAEARAKQEAEKKEPEGIEKETEELIPQSDNAMHVM